MINNLIIYAADGEKVVDICKNVSLDSIGNIFNWATCTLNSVVIPLLLTLAVVLFIWGIIQYFINPENEEKRKKAKGYLLWGIIGLFVIVSIWGLVGVLSETFGIKTLIPQLSNQ